VTDRRKPITRCPCCGQTVPDPIGFRPGLHLGAMQERLLRVLQRAPDGLTVRQIVDVVYANVRDDPPAHNSVAVMARQMNRKLAPLGLRIKGTGGPGSVYRLLREDGHGVQS
jgi:hypothetical protein